MDWVENCMQCSNRFNFVLKTNISKFPDMVLDMLRLFPSQARGGCNAPCYFMLQKLQLPWPECNFTFLLDDRILQKFISQHNGFPFCFAQQNGSFAMW